MGDYSYDDAPVEHDIFGVGCGAKFVRLFLRNKKMVAIIAGISVSPFLLAWICSLAVFKDMVKEEKYEVESDSSSDDEDKKKKKEKSKRKSKKSKSKKK